LKRMIWAARRDGVERGRPAPECGGRAYNDVSDGKMDLWSLAREVISRWEDASRAVYTSAGRAFSRSLLHM
jgi:hypothetical protein